MKNIKIFYLKNCPFCKRAFKFIDELKGEDSRFAGIDLTLIEESECPEIANAHDYYYVPTFYIDNEKVHEGGIYKEEVKAILEKALE